MSTDTLKGAEGYLEPIDVPDGESVITMTGDASWRHR